MMVTSTTLKAFIFSALLALVAADTCTDCTAVVNFIAARLTTEESIAAQSAVLVGGLCPTTEDPAACEAGLPGFWAAIAVILWPGYYDPSVSWTIWTCVVLAININSLHSRPNGCALPSVQLLKTLL